ncbi:HD-GYP domain-containing protein (c-di-GMP phosphodiesterase class II) [Rhodoferax ferrireducens]|uniref:HD-GYP domain-containing protein (C-di-GMP phosphodiesterase class II) n=1 Tax=Rhodoferax ferrireducens TaxID=192843 RepID=A0ABU2C2B9_9BURK|nr:phosphodiesterase [Rhodoferax ferrireducens]MDR7375488.1 HD-GYP domain-containing protein (c-di-GMP phosphodiesterase class II) [Rhodoferax ferrireducens]
MPYTHVPHPQDADYEDLLSLWADLESGLAMVLANPRNIPNFEQKIRQYDRWMQDLLQQDTDTGLYLLFQLATNASVGYSALHALVCAVLCHITSQELHLVESERDSLVFAAMTMNVAMTALQDTLAVQTTAPTTEQKALIHTHAADGRRLLLKVGIVDTDWLDVVAAHHDAHDTRHDFQQLGLVPRLAHTLRVVDRYAAMVSPRKSRTGRSVTDSVRSIMASALGPNDPVGFALVRAIGLCPPGTYVRMDNGETAVVLRRSSKANLPLVATLMNRKGEAYVPPRLHRTATSTPHVESALTQDAVKIRVNHQSLLRQGIYADRPAAPR